MIKVFDDVFSSQDQTETLIRLDTPRWAYTAGDQRSHFWHAPLENEPFFCVHLFNQIQQYVEEPVEIERVYANGQTAGQSGVPHCDNGDMTFLYYASMDMEGMGGNLLFFDENNDPKHVVGYKSNRAVLFDGKIIHHAESPSRHYNGLRISVAWKLRIVK